MQTWILTIGSLVVVSAISLVGVFFMSMAEERLRKVLLFLVSFAVGALFGDTFFELIPESYEHIGAGPLVPVLIMCGIMGFFALEKFMRWRHCHIPTSKNHPHPVVLMNLVGDAAHNFIDGLVVGASFLVSPRTGLATTVAVLLHEIPTEIGDFGILVHGGLKPKKALLLNFVSAVFAIAGGAIALLIGAGHSGFAACLLPVTAGGFIYIAGSDLIPALQQTDACKHSLLQFLLVVAGMALMGALLLTAGH